MKRLKFLFVLLLAFLFVVPGYARPFNQEKNNFGGVQYFEGGIILGTEADSLDTLTHVYTDTTFTNKDPNAIVTADIVGNALDKKADKSYAYYDYIFMVSQTGTDAPTVDSVLVNNFGYTGTITSSRENVGKYIFDISGLVAATPEAEVTEERWIVSCESNTSAITTRETVVYSARPYHSNGPIGDYFYLIAISIIPADPPIYTETILSRVDRVPRIVKIRYIP